MLPIMMKKHATEVPWVYYRRRALMTNDSNPVIEITLPGRDSKRNVSETGLRTEVEADYHRTYIF